MSKRKPTSFPKQARGTKIAAKAHGAVQAVIRSRKGRLASTTAKSPRKSQLDPSSNTSLIENQCTTFQEDSKGPEPTAASSFPTEDSDLRDPVPEGAESGFPADSKQSTTGDASMKLDPFSATASVWTYQAKLLEMAQANVHFAFDFAQRLGSIRSPIEFPIVIAEFTCKRIDFFQKYSKENG
jgi:hypothetical protein